MVGQSRQKLRRFTTTQLSRSNMISRETHGSMLRFLLVYFSVFPSFRIFTVYFYALFVVDSCVVERRVRVTRRRRYSRFRCVQLYLLLRENLSPSFERVRIEFLRSVTRMHLVSYFRLDAEIFYRSRPLV